jgi:hypothetical protein
MRHAHCVVRGFIPVEVPSRPGGRVDEAQHRPMLVVPFGEHRFISFGDAQYKVIEHAFSEFSGQASRFSLGFGKNPLGGWKLLFPYIFDELLCCSDASGYCLD